mmetsp:Transcript_5694/g.8462  ORF Transcript_5694/g.8462 Transcript_5694/m.8462 type:complete len:108 (-) Transcript_5694:79-402(-)
MSSLALGGPALPNLGNARLGGLELRSPKPSSVLDGKQGAAALASRSCKAWGLAEFLEQWRNYKGNFMEGVAGDSRLKEDLRTCIFEVPVVISEAGLVEGVSLMIAPQ